MILRFEGKPQRNKILCCGHIFIKDRELKFGIKIFRFNVDSDKVQVHRKLGFLRRARCKNDRLRGR